MLLDTLFERKSVGVTDALWAALVGGGAMSKSGVSVGTMDALACTTALACVRVLSSGVSMLPIKLVRDTANGGKENMRGHPLWDLVVDEPNQWQTGSEWIETMMMHAVLAQSGRSFINRLADGRIAELIPLVPEQVRVDQAADFTLTYTVTPTNGGPPVTLGRDQVFELRGPSWDGYAGLDVRRLAREAIGLSLATEETHARLHSNGARPGGILTSDNNLSDEQVSSIRDAWQSTQGGVANSMKTAILAGGLQWQQISMSGVDNQHIETRRHQIEEVCRAFGVFPAVIGHSNNQSTYASAEQFFLHHVILTLGPWIKRVEARLKHDLLSSQDKRSGLYWHVSTQAMLRGDHKTRSEFYRALVMLGVMTRNEARLLEEMNPLPGLDEPLTPLNLGVGAEPESDTSRRFVKAVADEVAAQLGRKVED